MDPEVARLALEAVKLTMTAVVLVVLAVIFARPARTTQTEGPASWRGPRSR